MIKRPNTKAQRIKRHKRVRAKISGTSERPRLSVYRSENNIYAQIIDDEMCIRDSHGGGEGKAPVGRPGPVTPWGKPALGYKTRKTKNPTDKFIVKRRNAK